MTPLPQSAVAVSLSPNGLNLFLPPTREGGRGHTIVIPADMAGMKALVDILRSREGGECRIGTPGAPTQRQVVDPRILEGYRGAIGKPTTAKVEQKSAAEKKRLEALAILQELGL